MRGRHSRTHYTSFQIDHKLNTTYTALPSTRAAPSGSGEHWLTPEAPPVQPSPVQPDGSSSSTKPLKSQPTWPPAAPPGP